MGAVQAAAWLRKPSTSPGVIAAAFSHAHKWHSLGHALAHTVQVRFGAGGLLKVVAYSQAGGVVPVEDLGRGSRRFKGRREEDAPPWCITTRSRVLSKCPDRL